MGFIIKLDLNKLISCLLYKNKFKLKHCQMQLFEEKIWNNKLSKSLFWKTRLKKTFYTCLGLNRFFEGFTIL